MERTIFKTLAQAGRASKPWTSTARIASLDLGLQQQDGARKFSQSTRHALREQKKVPSAENSTSQGQPAADLSQNVTKEEVEHYDKIVEHSKKSQMRSPWMHEGSDKPPVARLRSAGAMVKGMWIGSSMAVLRLTQ